MPLIKNGQIRLFRRKIFAWWDVNRRDLPWRKTRDPYRILVSEVMLQQTQVSRVLPKYAEFLNAYPDVRSLAAASAAGILTVWKGLGYNRRALYLKRTAEAVVRLYDGKFPDTESELVKLPGLGTYTARAIMVFAFEKDVAMVDTNIRQIITRFFYNGLPQKDKLIQQTADDIIPAGKSWEWHQALMDYGALALVRDRKKPEISSGPRKKTTPFRDSVRFYRGKIIDRLREGPESEAAMLGVMVREYKKPVGWLSGIVDGLVKDGLAVRKRKRIMLPA